ncbi:MAG: ABC transporter ATP-binding protein [Clostridiales bacterium]|nr:ABC transporter ATP-binding protein [Clostridiales bacterium]
MNKEIIKVENLTFEYPDQAVLKNVSFTLHKGDFLGIIGANGAGKSTLIKLILGLLKQDSGRITLFGTELSKVRSRVGYVSQKANSFNSDFPATVHEVVRANLLPLKGLFSRYTKDDEKKVDDALGLVGMTEYKNKLIGSLSGGQQQRVFIARALVSKPELLLMDEPTVGIDAASVREIMEIIEKLNKDGMTIIMTNHDTPTLLRAANKLLIFCEHGYEEFVSTADLSLERISDILAGKRVHHHG